MGSAFVHTAIDDHSRVAYAEVHDDETAATAVAVLRRAVAWYAARGMQVERVLSDNGWAYRSKLWTQTRRTQLTRDASQPNTLSGPRWRIRTATVHDHAGHRRAGHRGPGPCSVAWHGTAALYESAAIVAVTLSPGLADAPAGGFVVATVCSSPAPTGSISNVSPRPWTILRAFPTVILEIWYLYLPDYTRRH